jgi:hypothetical protein
MRFGHVAPVVAAAAMLTLAVPFQGQGQGKGKGKQASQSPKQAAAIDLTGNWVSVVTEDWRFRMVTPPKGEFGGVPLNAEGRRVANAWDPAKDEAAGEQCRAYGAAAVMRVPGRLRIGWDNDTTLRIETEAGSQTRLFRFGGQASAGEPSWQGNSVAEWEFAAPAKGQPRTGNLKVVTTGLRPGYLRKNGVPHSANALVAEYYDRHTAPNGDSWLVVTTEVKDPQYLTTPFITSTHFKKLPDNSPWKPEPCSAR